MKPQLTIFCYGGTLADTEAALQELFIEHEIAAEVVCPVSIFPLNIFPILQSVSITGKILTVEEGASFAGLGSEILAQLVSLDVDIKKAAQLGNNAIIPSSYKAELNLLTGKDKIVEATLKM